MLYAVEDRHFWFRARNAVITSLVKQVVSDLPAGYRVLEVGCGTGNVLRFLSDTCTDGQVIGMDLYLDGLRFARRRVASALVQGDMHHPPFKAQFSLIGLFDVLEHLQNDTQVLRDLHALLAPQGALLLTVPAYMSLWSYFDEESHHVRRYVRRELTQKLNGAGYQVEYLSYYMMSIFPLVWLGRRLSGLNAKNAHDNQQRAANELKITPVVNDVLRFILMQEARFIVGRRTLPFGTSLIALARKKAVEGDSSGQR